MLEKGHRGERLDQRRAKSHTEGSGGCTPRPFFLHSLLQLNQEDFRHVGLSPRHCTCVKSSRGSFKTSACTCFSFSLNKRHLDHSDKKKEFRVARINFGSELRFPAGWGQPLFPPLKQRRRRSRALAEVAFAAGGERCSSEMEDWYLREPDYVPL